MNYTDSISKNIKEFRVKNNMTQSELAYQVGVHVTHISQIELECKVNIGIRTIIKLCTAINMSIDELVGFKHD